MCDFFLIFMKRILIFILVITGILPVFGQNKANDLQLKFSGFIRGDLIYKNRESVTALEDLFYLYPKDHLYDDSGKDLNAQSSSGFYNLATRASLDAWGLKAFNSSISAKIEADFAGSGGSTGTAAIVRLRLAYLKIDRGNSSFLIGQNWHPMFQNIQPGQLTLSTGAPFQPFNRSPQFRYDYKTKKVIFRATAVYQLQNKSAGPAGKSNLYAKNAVLPELNGIIEYNYGSVQTGLGINFLSLTPRTQSEIDNQVYKVNETIRSLSYIAYFQYTEQLFTIGLKTVYGQNNTHLNMLGGYGIKTIDSTTGQCKYTNFNHSSSWLNLSYGEKYKGNLMFGYTKNMGTDDELIKDSNVYGDGLDIDNMYRIAGNFTYNIPHFSVGLEYELMNANYGDTGSFNWKKGKYTSTHGIAAHRLTGIFRYNF